MSSTEETIEATLDSNGQLGLTHRPHLPPGPVRVTIRVAAAVRPQRRGLADVIREIAADRRFRGFPGAVGGRRPRRRRRARPKMPSATGTGRRASRGRGGGTVSAVRPGHCDRHLRRRGQPGRPATGAGPPGRARKGRPSIRDRRADAARKAWSRSLARAAASGCRPSSGSSTGRTCGRRACRPRCLTGPPRSEAAVPTRRSRPPTRGVTGWPMLSISPPRSSPAVTCS